MESTYERPAMPARDAAFGAVLRLGLWLGRRRKKRGTGEGDAVIVAAASAAKPDVRIETGDAERRPMPGRMVEAPIVRYGFRETLEFNWS